MPPPNAMGDVTRLSLPGWRPGTLAEGGQRGQSGRRVPGAGAHLGHVLGDNVKAALLLHNHPQELHQVAVSELPARCGRAQGRVLGRRGPPPSAGRGGVPRLALSPPRRYHSRHDGRLCQKRLRCGIVFNALHGDFVPPVIPQHHVCGPGETGTAGTGKHPSLPGPHRHPGGAAQEPPSASLGPSWCWGPGAHLQIPLCQ